MNVAHEHVNQSYSLPTQPATISLRNSTTTLRDQRKTYERSLYLRLTLVVRRSTIHLRLLRLWIRPARIQARRKAPFDAARLVLDEVDQSPDLLARQLSAPGRHLPAVPFLLDLPVGDRP